MRPHLHRVTQRQSPGVTDSENHQEREAWPAAPFGNRPRRPDKGPDRHRQTKQLARADQTDTRGQKICELHALERPPPRNPT
ncbi:hypothetical protein GCM10010327_54360 [Streptomyces nitrosporeus]|nr:hypothetical protein GCM10010327_54360 [Streptomyces nitrosporeus]